MKRIVVICLVLVVVLSACSLPSISLFKKIINHDPPELTVDNSYFADLACEYDPACLPPEMQRLDHPIGMVREPSNVLGGLDPAYPMIVASTVVHYGDEEFPAVYINKCLGDQYIRYVIVVEGEPQLVDSVEQMAALYAPIESENEALSYAIATTGFSAVYDLHNFPRPKIYMNPIEETYVSEVEDAYLVHLFYTYLCGCGPHINRAVDVTVRKDGSISLSEFTEAYSDPKLDGMCVD